MSNCDELGELLDEYVDGEIDELSKCLVEAHLISCGLCHEQLHRNYHLRLLLGSADLRYTAPRHLRRSLERSTRVVPRSIVQRMTSWVVPATAGAVAASLVPFLAHVPMQAPIEQELVENHVRSLQANHLVDVSTSSEYAIGPWFSGRLDFAPYVPERLAGGFRLLGCRLDYAGGQALAALVYAQGDHKVNLFVWPAPVASDRLLERHGFTIVEWSRGELRYAAVSDASAGELADLRSAFRSDVRSGEG